MEAKEPRFKTKVNLANSIHTKLQQMQTDAWEEKANEWLAAVERDMGMNTKGHMFTILSTVIVSGLYIEFLKLYKLCI